MRTVRTVVAPSRPVRTARSAPVPIAEPTLKVFCGDVADELNGTAVRSIIASSSLLQACRAINRTGKLARGYWQQVFDEDIASAAYHKPNTPVPYPNRKLTNRTN